MIKKIEAIIREEKLNAVKKAISDIGIVGLTVTPVRGRGRGSGMQMQWRTGTYVVDLLPRSMITIVLSEDNVDTVVKAIIAGAQTGSSGDGMIFISPIDSVLRISSEERDREAITYIGDIDSLGVN